MQQLARFPYVIFYASIYHTDDVSSEGLCTNLDAINIFGLNPPSYARPAKQIQPEYQTK
jgi:hypothetical protein